MGPSALPAVDGPAPSWGPLWGRLLSHSGLVPPGATHGCPHALQRCWGLRVCGNRIWPLVPLLTEPAALPLSACPSPLANRPWALGGPSKLVCM